MEEIRRSEGSERTYLPADGIPRGQRQERARPGEDADAAGERALGAASATELATGAGVAALSIIGLAGVAPQSLLAVACIVAGAGLVLGGGATSPRARHLRSRARAEVEGGIGVELVAGAGAIVLGILALIGFAPTLLESVSAIALGGALLFSTVVPAQERQLGSSDQRAVRAGEGASAVQGLVGVGAIALGILSLVGVASRTLALVALLGIGAGMMLTGSALLAGAALSRSHAAA